MMSEPRRRVTVTVRLVTEEQVREHLGTNSTDTDELQRLIDDADAEVVRRCGPHKIDGSLTDVLRGGSVRLFPSQAVEGDYQRYRDGLGYRDCAIPRRLPDLVRGPDAGAACPTVHIPARIGESVWSSHTRR